MESNHKINANIIKQALKINHMLSGVCCPSITIGKSILHGEMIFQRLTVGASSPFRKLKVCTVVMWRCDTKVLPKPQ